jgi:TetR/AcrR family transcriptional regulator
MGIAERKEREKKKRRNTIIDAAEKVFFSKGMENATMDEVAEKAELSKGTLYLYFKNKEELLHGIVARGLEILLKMFHTAVKKEEKGIDKIKAIGRAYTEFYKTEPDYYGALLHQETHAYDPETVTEDSNLALCLGLGEEIFGMMRQVVEVGIKDGSIRNDLDPDRLPIVLWGHSAGVLHLVKAKGKIFADQFTLSPEEIIEYSFQLISHYLENKPDKK